MKTLAILFAIAATTSFAADRPTLAILDAPEIATTCDTALTRASKTVATLEATAGDNGFLGAWNRP